MFLTGLSFVLYFDFSIFISRITKCNFPHIFLLLGSSIADLTGQTPLNNSLNPGLVVNPYEKWSNGADSLFGLTPTQPQHDSYKVDLTLIHSFGKF